jgi:hypothetical protein
VNSFCARMFGLTLFVFLVLAIAVQPAIAQQDQCVPSGDSSRGYLFQLPQGVL